MKRTLLRYYRKMRDAHGHLNWWPGESRWEVIVGAILTQNTAWSNVEKAIASLKAANVLEPKPMWELPESELALLIRSSGYYNQKAKKLRTFLAYFRERHGGSLESMIAAPTDSLRKELLSLNGIGPETADSILLYALDHSVFVIDAYTKRIMSRHGHAGEGVDYHDLQALFTRHLPKERDLYNDYHAQLVRVGNRHCKKGLPECDLCPLGSEKDAPKIRR